tara:strand:- start:128 stop:313 length:186 start_codon:yes stop_codon:yes gene_type:complete
MLTLTRHAQPNPRKRLTPRQGDFRIALLAVGQTFTCRKLAAGSLEPIFYGAINLILNRAVF